MTEHISNLDKIYWESTINDIPCFIRVDNFVQGYPPVLTGPMEDADPGSPDEVDYTILDHRNIIAPWLKKQITDADDRRFTEEFYITKLEIKHYYQTNP